MKILLAGLLLSTLAAQAGATPSSAIVDTCLRPQSTSPKVHYTSITVDTFNLIEDDEAGKTEITLQYGADTIGIWDIKKPKAFGLIFNGKETPLASIIALDKRTPPTSFNPYEAMWGEVHQGNKSYICATFNFDGLGKSGSFQSVRGLYLIERQPLTGATFYMTSNITVSEN